MFHRFHQRFGTAGVIIGVIALVAALSGTALAAKGALTGKQKKEVEKIAKKYAGAPGVPGSAGANGKDGTNGANGADGKEGPEGKQGKEGKEGKAGKDGLTGFTETLPPGKTETGVWGMAEAVITFERQFPVPISFPIPLPTSVTPVYLNQAETHSEAETGGCKWEFENTEAAPEAPPGKLCVFTDVEANEGVAENGFTYFGTPGEAFAEVAAPEGVNMIMTVHGTTEQPRRLEATGTWAVTAPEG